MISVFIIVTIVRPSYFYNGKPFIWKDVLFIETDPDAILQTADEISRHIRSLQIHSNELNWNYRQTANTSRTLEGNKIVDHSDVVGSSPVGAAPLHLRSRLNSWLQ